MSDKLDLKTVTMDDLNGGYITFSRLSGSGDVFYNRSRGYHHAFKIEDNKAYDYTMDDKGKLVQDTKPIVSLEDIKVPDPKDPTKQVTVPGVRYIAKRYNQDPYVLHDEVQESKIIGDRPAVAFLSALKLYIQSLQFFAYDSYVASETGLLGDFYKTGDPVNPTTTTTTTTSTTKKPTTTTTTTTTTSTTTKSQTDSAQTDSGKTA